MNVGFRQLTQGRVLLVQPSHVSPDPGLPLRSRRVRIEREVGHREHGVPGTHDHQWDPGLDDELGQR